MFWKKKERNHNLGVKFTSPNPVANEVAKALAVDGENNSFDEFSKMKNKAGEIIDKWGKKFTPEHLEWYYRVSEFPLVEARCFTDDSNSDLADLVKGNCYKTIIEAERARIDLLEKIEKMKETLKK